MRTPRLALAPPSPPPARLSAAADRELASTGEWTSRWLQADDGGRIDATRAALADPRYDAAWAAGATLTVEQALDAARSAAAMAEPAAGGELPDLTSRELDVLRLLTGDSSDAESPQELVGQPAHRACERATPHRQARSRIPLRRFALVLQAQPERQGTEIGQHDGLCGLRLAEFLAGRLGGRRRQRPLVYGEPRVDMSPVERPVSESEPSLRADCLKIVPFTTTYTDNRPPLDSGISLRRVADASPGEAEAPMLPRGHDDFALRG